MTETKKEIPVTTQKYDSELDYLTKSLDFLNTRHTSILKDVRRNKEEMELLKEDIRGITSPRLKEAAMKTFNHFSMQNTKLNNTIKEIRVDQKWVKRIIKIVMEWMRGNE